MRAITPLLLAAAVLVLGACDGKSGRAGPADANTTYLANNAKKAGVVSVPGIQYEVLQKGDGPQPDRKDCVTVNYKGMLTDG